MFEIEIIRNVPGNIHPRMWKKGDRPTVSKVLMNKLVQLKFAKVISEGDTRRGISQDEFDQLVEAEKQKETAQKNKKSKIIIPENMQGKKE